MKRLPRILIVAAVLVGCFSTIALTQAIPVANFKNMLFFVKGCTSYTPPTAPPPAGAAICVDTSTYQIFTWNGSAFTLPNNMIQSISWDGSLGGMTSSAAAISVAPCTGHFTELVCTATLTGSCTTGPTIAVKDITASTVGSTVVPGTTVASPTATTATLAFTAGDQIALAADATPSACASPSYHCAANLTCP
jgi:hypothetical protein